MKAFRNHRLAATGALMALLAGSACLSKTPQQKYLAELAAQDSEIGRFKLSTGKDGATAWVSLDDADKDARPMEAIRAFMWVAYEYRNERFDAFELRFRGTPKILFTYPDTVELSTAFRKNDRMLFVLQETLNRAKHAGRSPAAAIVAPRKHDPSRPPTETLMGMMSDLQTFLRAWYMEGLGRTGI